MAEAWESGVWRAVWEALKPRIVGIAVSDILFGLASAVTSALIVPGEGADGGDRITAAIGGFGIALAAGLVIIACWVLLRMPYRQRNAARAAFKAHMDSEHGGEFLIAIRGPTVFSQFDPAFRIWPFPEYLMTEVNFPIINNRTGRDWNLQVLLDGWLGGRHLEIDNREWRLVWNRHPKTRERFFSNPLEVERGAVKERSIPFLIPYDAALEGKRLQRPRLTVKDNKSSQQHVLLLPANEDGTVEDRWSA